MNTIENILRAAEFAAVKHTGQTRKGSSSKPYINHPIQVARLIASVGGISDKTILMAALLHDTVEDTGTTADELRLHFGQDVTDVVLEVTDDKSLPKLERKRLQIEHAPHLSPNAKIVKLADKISNITEVAADPPKDWPLERRRDYLDWASNVVAGLRGANEHLESHFDEALAEARRMIG